MSKIALTVVIECEPHKRNEVVQALSSHRKRCLETEAGTLQFDVLIPVESQSDIHIYELYVDEKALSDHSQGSSMAQYREEVKNITLNVNAQKCILMEDR